MLHKSEAENCYGACGYNSAVVIGPFTAERAVTPVFGTYVKISRMEIASAIAVRQLGVINSHLLCENSKQ